ncbi:MAG: hypothetical protein QNL04_01970 [SAR324 cluster bacterium]|nr:hypothetical protein [SAR324 cluster bacterium]
MEKLPDLSSFPVDERGHMGRECPEDDCLEQFSIKRMNDTLPEVHFCPTCGFKDTFDAFWTENQLQRIDSILGDDEADGCDKPAGAQQGEFNFERPKTETATVEAKKTEPQAPKGPQEIFEYEEESYGKLYACGDCGVEFAMEDPPQNCAQCGSNVLEQL